MAISGTDKSTNQFGVSWFDSNWIPHLSKDNILDYFSERSNPFYDRNCNNEILKMQQRGLEHLENMTGLEYILLHFQDPILYVIRKQKRLSPTKVTVLADYHIIAGIVYQTPDVGTIINSRMASTLYHLDAAFSETVSFSRYHPAKGYSWQFKEKEQSENKPKKGKKKEEPGSSFQCSRVDALLNSLTLKFPFKYVQARPGERPVPIQDPPKVEVKTEKQNPSAPAARPNPPSRSASAAAQAKQEAKVPAEKRMRFIT